jgi:hypothetical protein
MGGEHSTHGRDEELLSGKHGHFPNFVQKIWIRDQVKIIKDTASFLKHLKTTLRI